MLLISLIVTPAFATWYVHQSEGHYKQEDYRNEKYGNFVPADIDQKIFRQLLAEEQKKTKKPQARNAPVFFNNDQTVPASIQQAPNPAQKHPEQNFRRPAYNGQNRTRYYIPSARQKYNQGYQRNTNFNRSTSNDRK